jgi:hypothetical protein
MANTTDNRTRQFIKTFVQEIENAVKEIAERHKDEIAISLEIDHRGYSPVVHIRIKKDKTGGLIARQEYERAKGGD